MSKSKNIIQKKKSQLDGIKFITKWLFSSRDEESLNKMIEKYEFDNHILKRLVSYVYNFPHLVWYINKYMNDLFQFNKMNTVSLFYTFGYLLDINQRNNSKKLFYLKSNELADRNKTKIKELLFEYFSKLYDRYYNENELNFIYDLISIGKITPNDIVEIDHHLNSGKESISIEIENLPIATDIISSNYNIQVLDFQRDLPITIQLFCNNIKAEALTRPECKKCELYGKPVVVLDTNCEDLNTEVDIAFIGLNPGKDEVTLNKPFVGKSGKLLREFISKLPRNVKWLITNVILCHTKNEKDIKDPETCMLNCSYFVGQIFRNFPCKCFVPLGAKATNYFQIEENITSASGKKFDFKNYTVIPIIHPSSAANYGQLEKFRQSFQTIYNLFSNKQSTTTSLDIKSQTTETATEEIKTKTPEIDDSIITEVTPDLTFFDVREVNDKIIKIFINSKGEKKYLIEDYNMQFFVKDASWKQCDQIVDDVTYYINITNKDKQLIINKVRQKFNDLKNI